MRVCHHGTNPISLRIFKVSSELLLLAHTMDVDKDKTNFKTPSWIRPRHHKRIKTAFVIHTKYCELTHTLLGLVWVVLGCILKSYSVTAEAATFIWP